MIINLKNLSKQLLKMGYINEFLLTQEIIKKSISNKPQQELKIFQDEKYQKQILFVLKTIGIKPTQENVIEFLQSMEYLKNGITDNNLLLSGINLIKLIPNLEKYKELFTIIQNQNNLNETIKVAKIIQNNKENIKGILNRFKIKNVIDILNFYNHKLLPKYIDQIWTIIYNWSFKIINSYNTQVEINEKLNNI